MDDVIQSLRETLNAEMPCPRLEDMDVILSGFFFFSSETIYTCPAVINVPTTVKLNSVQKEYRPNTSFVFEFIYREYTFQCTSLSFPHPPPNLDWLLERGGQNGGHQIRPLPQRHLWDGEQDGYRDDHLGKTAMNIHASSA